MAYDNRNSNALRASVYDVFLELGALDANSRVADWFFTDPDLVLPDPDVFARRRTRQSVRLRHDAPPKKDADKLVVVVDTPTKKKRPQSASKSFGLNFSPKRIKSRSPSQAPSNAPSNAFSSPTTSQTNSPTDGYDTDEGYGSASQGSSPRYKKSRVRAAFSLPSSARSPTPEGSTSSTTTTPPKPLPSLPPIRERLTRTVSSSSVTVAKAKSLFRKRPTKSPSGGGGGGEEDDLQEWHDFPALTPRVFNPSVDNGAALAPAPAPPSSFRQVPPSSFLRHIVATPLAAGPEERRADADDALDNNDNEEPNVNLAFALPRTLFRTLSLTKRRSNRPRPLTLLDEPDPNFDTPPHGQASSLPASPFILVSATASPGGTEAGPNTPFVLVAPIENPSFSPNSANGRGRRFSDVTSMTAPGGGGVYPLSIARTLRRSMNMGVGFDYDAGAYAQTPSTPAFPRLLRPSSSYGSLQDALALATSTESPYAPLNLQRGRVSPFPARPILPEPLSYNSESRMATIRRYREFSEQLVEVGVGVGGYDNGRE
ncbi:hypothetical protein C8R46DRAFT_1273371 [Mycena filopes]|nr:hypothetical protein C8R46DRAFT_1273371 [Mycena filopes]